MTDLVLVIALGCALLVVLGALIGHSLDEHLRDQHVRRQAAVQREIAEQWRELRERRARRHPAVCPNCGAVLGPHDGRPGDRPAG